MLTKKFLIIRLAFYLQDFAIKLFELLGYFLFFVFDLFDPSLLGFVDFS